MNKTVVIVAAILAIAGLEALALQKGHDGALLATVVAAIGALAGGGVGYNIGLYKPTPPKEESKP